MIYGWERDGDFSVGDVVHLDDGSIECILGKNESAVRFVYGGRNEIKTSYLSFINCKRAIV